MGTPEHDELFQGLLKQHKGILYKIYASYCRTRDDREDLAQEILMQIWRSFERFDERYRFSTWMYRIALNVAISFARRESTRAWHVVSDEDRALRVADQTASEPEEVRLLYEFIETLDDLNKGLVLLYLDGNSYAEIAGVLGISENERSYEDRPVEKLDEAGHLRRRATE